MYNKKSQVGIIIFVIILAILILVGIFFAIYGSQKGWFSKTKGKEVITIPSISLFLKVSDENNNPIKADYYIEADNEILKQGVSERSWNQILGMPINKTYQICFWNDNYYRQCHIYTKYFSSIVASKIGKNITYKNITMDEHFTLENLKGKIEISTKDKLQVGQEQKIRLKISVQNGTFSNLLMCTWHSVGIVSMAKPEITLYCSKAWLNYTFNAEGQQVNLTNYRYWCQPTNTFANCKAIEYGDNCIQPNIKTPPRLKDKADFCYYTGRTITNGDYIAEYDVKTMPFIDQLDYINFYIVDEELTKINGEYDLHDTDYEGKDVGIPDILYQLNYTK